MFVWVLFGCVSSESAFQIFGDPASKLAQALVIARGFGMSIQGVRTCGDYMFSGHTVVITVLNHFITECKYLSMD